MTWSGPALCVDGHRDEDLDAMLREIEGEDNSGPGTHSTGTKQTPVVSEASGSGETAATGATGEEEGSGSVMDGEKEESGATVLTPAQKKAAKKEREKKKKEALRQARLAQQEKAKDSGVTMEQKGVPEKKDITEGNEEVCGVVFVDRVVYGVSLSSGKEQVG